MSVTDNSHILAVVTREIEAVHDFIAAWFRGALDNSDQVFNDGLADRLHGRMVNIQPSGQSLTRAELLDPIRAAHGANPDFRIRISDVVVRFVDNDRTVVLASYIEHQTGARNTTPSANDRVSTVLFEMPEGPGGRLVWLHIHETARPML